MLSSRALNRSTAGCITEWMRWWFFSGSASSSPTIVSISSPRSTSNGPSSAWVSYSRCGSVGGATVRTYHGCERLLDRLGRVAEVEHERAGLVGVRAVQPRQRLHGGEAGEGLVDVHRVELRLVEAGLVLLGDDEDLPVVGVEPLGRLRLGEPVDPRLGPLLPLVVELAGERAQHADVADAVLGAVLVERPLVPQRVEPGGGDHHRLRLAADLARRRGSGSG